MGRDAARSASAGAIPTGAAESTGSDPVSARKVGEESGVGAAAPPWRGDGVAISYSVALRPWLMIVVMPRTAPQASTKQTAMAAFAERVWDGSGRAISCW